MKILTLLFSLQLLVTFCQSLETENAEIVPVEESEQSLVESSEVGTPWWVYLVVVLAILILAGIAAAIGYLLWKKRQNGTPVPTEDPEEKPKPADPEAGVPLIQTKPETEEKKEETEEKIEA